MHAKCDVVMARQESPTLLHFNNFDTTHTAQNLHLSARPAAPCISHPAIVLHTARASSRHQATLSVPQGSGLRVQNLRRAIVVS